MPRFCSVLSLLSLPGFLTLVRFGIRTIFRFHAVVDQNRGRIPKPENTRADDFVAGIDSRSDRNLIAAAAFDLYDLLFHSSI